MLFEWMFKAVGYPMMPLSTAELLTSQLANRKLRGTNVAKHPVKFHLDKLKHVKQFQKFQPNAMEWNLQVRMSLTRQNALSHNQTSNF